MENTKDQEPEGGWPTVSNQGEPSFYICTDNVIKNIKDLIHILRASFRSAAWVPQDPLQYQRVIGPD